MSSYVVLARKYRPRRFAEMVGQEHVVQALTHALATNRLHHAYLFTGTRGIGKTTVSRILAKSLNCVGPDGSGGITAEPCGVCGTCTAIDADRYIDYIELDAASNRGIDDARDLIERAAYKPSVGRYKVFMIDEAHQLTKDAFNALLKTLEEPPEHLKFVLATTDPEKMLPTVLSRCLQFNLRPMAPATVREHLARVLAAEGVPFDEGALRILGRAARGSMRDGLSLTDQAIAYGGGRVEEATVRAMLGSVERSHALALVQALAARDAAALLGVLEELRERGVSAAGTLEAIAQLAQQAAVEQAVPGALDEGDPDTADARAVAARVPADELQLLYSIALHGRSELALVSDEMAALTMVLLRFLAFPPSVASAPPAASSSSRMSGAPALPGASGPMPASTAPASRSAPLRASAPAAVRVPVPDPGGAFVAPSSTPSPPATRSTPVTPSTSLTSAPAHAGADARALDDRWNDLVGQLVAQGSVQALVRELAWSSGLIAIDTATRPTTWRLAVEREPLRSSALRDRLAAALGTFLGEALQLELVAATPADSPALREAAERARLQAEAEATIRSDPVVRDLLAQFQGARIVPGSIRPA
jgi:DNA polymerase-3 subunit gamma/tau